jgi:hypothetical protein
MDSPLSRARAHRLADIIADVRTRLRRICAEMPTPSFDTLVERIAQVQLKYEKDLFLGDRIWT